MAKGTRITDFESLLRDFIHRLEVLERAVPSVGDWRLDQDAAGNLVAINGATGAVRILAVP